MTDTATADSTTTSATGNTQQTTQQTQQTQGQQTLATEQQQQTQGYWPQDWRTNIAGEDKDALKQLERYASPSDIFKKARELEKTFSSGKLKATLPENPTEADIAAYRKSNGIPETDAGYLEKIALPDGVVLGENDKPLAESFAKVAHENNWTPAQFNQALGWYYNQIDSVKAAQDERDAQSQLEAADALRAEWGAEYRGNINAMNNMLNAIPGGEKIKELIFSARSQDGKILGDHPEVLKYLTAMAKQWDPASPLVPQSSDAIAAITSRKSELESWMSAKEGSPEWQKYWKSEQAQADYRQILDSEARRKSRAA